VQRKLYLNYGVYPKIAKFTADYEETVQNAFKSLKDEHKEIKKVLLLSYYLVDKKEYPLITIRDL
jgi:hypothetical protein